MRLEKASRVNSNNAVKQIMIEQGDKVQYQFVFTNTGDADLIIKDAQASCGCTTPSYPFVPIKPGETGSIGVTFSSVGKMGTQRPSITVTSNAHPRVTTLHLEGFVTDKLAKNELVEPNIIVDGKENVAKGGEIIKKEEPVIEEAEPFPPFPPVNGAEPFPPTAPAPPPPPPTTVG